MKVRAQCTSIKLVSIFVFVGKRKRSATAINRARARARVRILVPSALTACTPHSITLHYYIGKRLKTTVVNGVRV